MILIFIFYATSGSLLAQTDNNPIICGNYTRIHSNLLGEDRTLLIRLPEDYGKSDKTYPVLYKLDGEKGNFLQAFTAAYYLFDYVLTQRINRAQAGPDVSKDKKGFMTCSGSSE